MPELEDLYLRIEELERENAKLRSEKSQKRARLPTDFGEKFPNVAFAFRRSNIYDDFCYFIRATCFPKSDCFMTRGGCEGRDRVPAPMRLSEMTEDQFTRYSKIVEQLASVLEPYIFKKGE